MSLNESIIESATLTWFGELGYAIGHGPHLAPGEPAAESACASHADRRASFGDVVLVGRLREAIWRLNPIMPEEAREDALRKVLRVGTPSLAQTNRALHRLLRDGVPVEYPRPGGGIAGDHVRLVDFDGSHAPAWEPIPRRSSVAYLSGRWSGLDCVPTLERGHDQKAAPLYAQIIANRIQSRTLATLRDTLLPKLLSGELSVASPL